MERETELWKDGGMDGEVIVHSQGAVGEVKHIAWGLFQISLLWLWLCVLAVEIQAECQVDSNLLPAAFQHLHWLQAHFFS